MATSLLNLMNYSASSDINNKSYRFFLSGILLFVFGIFSCSSRSVLLNPPIFVPEIVAAFPVENEAQADSLYAELIAADADGYLEVIDMLRPPGSEDDHKARFALGGLSGYLSQTGQETHRATYQAVLLQALSGNYPNEIKQFIIAQLQWVGNEAAIPVLAGHLANSALVDPAARTMLSIDPAAAEQAIISALPKALWPANLSLIQALGDIDSDKAVPLLLERTAENHRAGIRQAALVALAEIGNLKAYPLLQTRFQAEKTDKSAQSYLRFAAKRAAVDDAATAADICREILAATTLPAQAHLQSAALSQLLPLEQMNAFPYLLDAVRSDIPALRTRALTLSEALPPQKSIRIWIAELPTFSVDGKAAVLQMLAGRGDQRALPSLLEALEDPEAKVRHSAMHSVFQLAGMNQFPAMLRAIPEWKNNEDIRILQALLSTVSSDELLPAVVANLSTAPAGAQAMLLAILAGRNAVQYREQVFEFAAAGERPVRVAALRALETLATPADQRHLLDLMLTAENNSTRNAAQKALVVVSQKMQGDMAADALLLDRFPHSTEEEQVLILQALGRIGGGQSLDLIIYSQKNGSAQMQDAAVRALAAWPDTLALPTLRDIAQNAPSEIHRILALRGFIRLANPELNLSNERRLEIYQQALPLSNGNQEKRQLLSGLSTLPMKKAATMAGEFLTPDSPLQNEAATALLKLAEPLLDVDKEAAISAANLVSTNDNISPAIREAGEALLAEFERYDNFLMTWEVSGPYTLEDGSLFNHQFAPEIDDGKSAKWEAMPVHSNPRYAWRMDLDDAIVGDTRVAYLRCKIYSPFAMPARLETGSDDGLKVWFNGKIVLANNVSRGVTPGDDLVPVVLRKGINFLTIKVVNIGGNWGACARVRTPDGKKIPGLYGIAGGEIPLQPESDEIVATPDDLPPGDDTNNKPRSDRDAMPQELFNGRDLGGWQIINAAEGSWGVEDGFLVTSGEGAGWLSTTRMYNNFHLSLEFKLPPGGNSGVFIRAPHRGDPAYTGMEIQVLDDYAEKYATLYHWQYTGSIYAIQAPAKRVSKPAGQWQKMEIIALDSRIRVVLNGEEIVDTDLTAHQQKVRKSPGMLRRSGYIGLQNHGSKVFYKNLTIIKL